ncbi:MAG TPA: ABC transporter permease [Verrucomicrobiae bacterium]|nr:ABC transporter permease [Verrucomicrobiae bacterium]
MESLLQDIRYALRTLWKTPGFTLTAIAALAIGIGANTAIFTVVKGVLLTPLPYPDSQNLVMVWDSKPSRGWPKFAVSPGNFLDRKRDAKSFEQLVAFQQATIVDAGGTEPVSREGYAVSEGFFAMVRTQPSRGRAFLPEDFTPGKGKVAVLSDALWKSRFGGREDVLGQPVTLSGSPHTIVGVMPADFRMPSKSELLLPLAFTAEDAEQRGGHYLTVMGRLAPGVTAEACEQEMKTLAAQSEKDHPDSNNGWTAKVTPLFEQMVAAVRPALLMLTAAVGFVLLIACANVANLLLARSETRRAELAVRSALGARRGRLVRQLLTESVVLATAGGALGLLMAYWGIDVLRTLRPDGLPRLESIRLDPGVLLFTAGIAIVTGLVFGTAPAFVASRTRISETLKEGGRAISPAAGRRLRGVLVSAQVALSLVLLIGAGLQVRSLVRLLHVDPGFDTTNVLSLEVSLPERSYPEGPAQVQYFEKAVEAVRALPGVVTAAAVSTVPLTGQQIIFSLEELEGRPPNAPGDHQSAYWYAVTPDYFATLKLPLKRGRLIEARDTAQAARVMLINESFAKRMFPGEDPIGRHVRIGIDGKVQREVVGIVGDVRHDGLDSDVTMQMYEPLAQRPWDSMNIILRTAVPPASLGSAARQAILGIDREQPVSSAETFDEIVAKSTAQRRFSLLLMTVFAGAALALTAIGLYGVVSYFVSLRTHEIGVRLALGATRREILALVVGQGMRLALAGVGLGLVTAFAGMRLLSSLLFGISATDPLTFIAVATGVAAVTLCASAFPAWRAARVDPSAALRSE